MFTALLLLLRGTSRRRAAEAEALKSEQAANRREMASYDDAILRAIRRR